MLALPIAGLLFYAALVKRPGPGAEVARILASGVIVLVGFATAMGNPTIMFLIPLGIPVFLAATQCLWEMKHALTERDRTPPEIRLSVFSTAFYASCAIAYILLKYENLNQPWIQRQLLAGGMVVLSMVAWECSHIQRLRLGRSTDRLSTAGHLRRWGIGVALAVLALLALLTLLPPVAEYICSFSPNLRTTKEVNPNYAPPHKTNSLESLPPSSDSKEPVSVSEETARSGLASLPKRAKIEFSDQPRAHLKFDDTEAGESLSAQGPLYLRSFGMSKYSPLGWQPGPRGGYWLKDEEDKTTDQIITLSPPAPSALHYSVYIPNSNGYAVPMLAGAQQIDVPKLYVLPDEWYQISDQGHTRIGGRSQAKVWGKFDPGKCHAGTIDGPYLNLPDGSLGETLRELSAGVIKAQRSPNDVIPLLMAFFRQHYTYSSTTLNPDDKHPLENFLLIERKGYCDLFASSAALLLRKAEIPSRVAFGYMGGLYDPQTGTHTFQQRHAHSWVEVYLREHGWVICEFTPEAGLPSKQGFQGIGAAVDLQGFQDPAQREKAAAMAARLNPPVEKQNLLTQIQAYIPSVSKKTFTYLAAAAIFTMIFWMWWKRRIEQSTPESKARIEAEKRNQQPGYFTEFLILCREVGHTENPGETLLELLRILRLRRVNHVEFEHMTAYHYSTRYADAPREKFREERFVKVIRQVRKEQIASGK